MFTPQNCCMNMTCENVVSWVSNGESRLITYDFRTDEGTTVPGNADEFFDRVASLRSGFPLRFEGHVHLENIPSGLDIVIP